MTQDFFDRQIVKYCLMAIVFRLYQDAWGSWGGFAALVMIAAFSALAGRGVWMKNEHP